jgi:dTDP-4-amino-4,6-dideoxygalactose transaminase
MPAVLAPEVGREQFMAGMREAGIQTSIHYPPIHRFSHYAAASAATTSLPVTDAIASRVVTLPLYPAMTQSDVQMVCDACAATLELAASATWTPI